MSTRLLYHAFSMSGHQYARMDYRGGDDDVSVVVEN